MNHFVDSNISRRSFLVSLAGAGITVMYPSSGSAQSRSSGPDYAVAPVPLANVEINDGFWTPRIRTTREVTLPHLLQHAGSERATDGRLVEAAAYFISKHPDPALQKQVDGLSDAAIRSVRAHENIWPNVGDGLFFSAGHFIEGAVAYYQATGDRKLLNAAIEVANNLDSVFGPGKRYDIANHEELELALVKLYRVTGDRRYVTLSKFLVDTRGTRAGGREMMGWYSQDDRPIREQQRAIGHCVRATYLYSGVADLAALTNDASYHQAVERIWHDAIGKRTYLTGGIGSYRQYENYGDDYDLPNLSCWNEICASVGNILWNHRMFLLSQDAQCIDVMERILYNGLLAGVSFSGDKFLYQAPLKATAEFERQPWFGPNCCPPNITRLVAQLGGLLYAVNGDNLYVNLFMSNRAHTEVNKVPVRIEQETNYPWEGKVRIGINPAKKVRFALQVRIPGWAQSEPMPGSLYRYEATAPATSTLLINGAKTSVAVDKGYARIERDWVPGDSVELTLPMRVQQVRAHDLVLENRNLVALERGPLVFCAEAIDNQGNINNFVVDSHSQLRYVFEPGLLNGIGTIQGSVLRAQRGPGKTVTTHPGKITAIPFYAFGNRGKSEMSVWLPATPEKTVLPPAPTLAARSKATSSCGEGAVADNYPGHNPPTVGRRMYPSSQDGSGHIRAIADQVQPVNSEDGSGRFLRLRPQTGSQAWVQYDFPARAHVSSVDVYWKDDKQFCLLPKSWRLLYSDGSSWKPVQSTTGFPVARDKYVTAAFAPVVASGVRLEIELQSALYKKGDLGPPNADYMKEDTPWYEGGVIEWRVNG
ncbi:MAG TPA: beta-L-arabinofuranosidase domain-containing protein [Acidobacteriaceae bacterium]|jgi:hypothetical protein